MAKWDGNEYDNENKWMCKWLVLLLRQLDIINQCDAIQMPLNFSLELKIKMNFKKLEMHGSFRQKTGKPSSSDSFVAQKM